MNDRSAHGASLDDLLALAAGRAGDEARARVRSACRTDPAAAAELAQWRVIGAAVAAAAAERAAPLPDPGPLLAAARALPAPPIGRREGGASGTGLVTAGVAVLALLGALAGARWMIGPEAPAAPRRTPAAAIGPSTSAAALDGASDRDETPSATAPAAPRGVVATPPPRRGAGGPPPSIAAPAGLPLAPETAPPIATVEPADRPSQPPAARTARSETPDRGPTSAPTREPTREPTSEPTREPTDEPTDEPTREPTDEPTREPTREPTDEPTREPTATPTPTDGTIVFAIDGEAASVRALAWPLEGGEVRTLEVTGGSAHRLPPGPWLFVARPPGSEPAWLGDGEVAPSPLELAAVRIAAGEVVEATWRFRALPADRAVLQGRVEGGAGEPAQRAVAHARDAAGRVLSVAVLPGAGGRFEVAVPVGSWSLAATAGPHGEPSWGDDIAIGAGETSGPIVLRLP